MTPQLQVTEAQNKAFLLANPDALVALVQDQLRERHAPLVARLDEVSFRQMARNAVARARKHGFTDPEDLAGFAVACFAVAPNFDRHPRIRRAFGRAREQAGPVFATIVFDIDEAVWAEARARYDETAWFEESAAADL